MAWQAQLMVPVGADYNAGKLTAAVEFYDDADRPATAVADTFSVEISAGTAAQQRTALRTAVEVRGAQIRAIHDKMVTLQGQVPALTTIPIP